MKETKHTPGPWKRGEYDDSLGYDCMTGGIWIAQESSPLYDCIVCLDASNYGQGRCAAEDDPWDRERMEADARLIAAAPDLLAALELLYGATPEALECDFAMWDSVRAAIAKVKGE